MSEPHVIRAEGARRDILQEALYLEERSPQASERFLDAVEATIARVADRPGLGAPALYARPELAGLRCVPVDGFKRHLVFYFPREGGIEVVRVLHGARDLGVIFGAGGTEAGP